MRTTRKLLSALICIILVSTIFTPVLAADLSAYSLEIPCRFDGNGGIFHNGLASVQNGGKYGLIDKAGNIIAPFEYDQLYVQNFSKITEDEVDYYIAIQNNKWGILDQSGKLVIQCQYDSVWDIHKGRAVVGIGEPRPPGGGTINGKWGFVDIQSGKEILPVQYNGISPSDDYQFYMVQLSNKFGVIDHTGKFIVPIGKYDYITSFKEGYAIVQKAGKYGVIDQAGKLVIPVVYDRIDHFTKGLALAVKSNKYGVLNPSGKIVVPFIYDDGGITKHGAIYMRQKSKDIIFNNGGGVIAPLGKYKMYLGVGQMEDLIYVMRGEKVGAIDITGKEIVPFIYTGVREINYGMAYVTDNDRAAVINRYGKVILPLGKYGLINLHGEGCVLVVSAVNGRQGLIGEKGNTILPYDYWSIGLMRENYIVAYNEKGSALFDKEGNIIVPFGDFDTIGYYISENMVDVTKNGLTGYIKLPPYVEKPDTWAKPEVDRAIAAGLVPEDMRVNYRDNITRADFCRLAINLIEAKTGMKIDNFMNTRGMSGRLTPPISFTDTSDTYVLAASRLGIVKGIGNNRFDPKGKITRQDAAVMLWKAATVLDFTEPKETPVLFSDRNQFAKYAIDAIAFVSAAADKESGIRVMAGTAHNKFSPNDNYTREQAYLTMLRLFNAI